MTVPFGFRLITQNCTAWPVVGPVPEILGATRSYKPLSAASAFIRTCTTGHKWRGCPRRSSRSNDSPTQVEVHLAWPWLVWGATAGGLAGLDLAPPADIDIQSSCMALIYTTASSFCAMAVAPARLHIASHRHRRRPSTAPPLSLLTPAPAPPLAPRSVAGTATAAVTMFRCCCCCCLGRRKAVQAPALFLLLVHFGGQHGHLLLAVVLAAVAVEQRVGAAAYLLDEAHAGARPAGL